jgi:hypothetical protein
MGIVHEPVEDAVGDGGIADLSGKWVCGKWVREMGPGNGLA